MVRNPYHGKVRRTAAPPYVFWRLQRTLCPWVGGWGLTRGSCMANLNGAEKNCHWKNKVTVISQRTETQLSVSNSSYMSRGQVWVWDSGLCVGVRGWWIPGIYFLQYFMDRKIFQRNHLEFQKKNLFFTLTSYSDAANWKMPTLNSLLLPEHLAKSCKVRISESKRGSLPTSNVQHLRQ